MSAPVLRFGRNTSGGRDLIVSDPHGCFGRLAGALHAVGFDASAGDILYILGDLGDRGPHSIAMLDWLAKPWVRALRGNHDQMAIDWARGAYTDAREFTGNGGGWFMELEPAAQHAIADVLDQLPIAMELETEDGLLGLVHAGCPLPDWGDFVRELEDPAATPQRMHLLKACAMWDRSRSDYLDDSVVTGVHAVVVGHTIVQGLTALGNTYYIDTGAFLPTGSGGHFTIIDAKTLRKASIPPTKW